MVLKKKEKDAWFSEALHELALGNLQGFFYFVDEKVHFSIETTHPTTGTSRIFRSRKEAYHLLRRVEKQLKTKLNFEIQNVYKDEKQHTYIVCLRAVFTTADETPFVIPQCWIMKVAHNPDRIITLQMYADSFAIAELYQEQGLAGKIHHES